MEDRQAWAKRARHAYGPGARPAQATAAVTAMDIPSPAVVVLGGAILASGTSHPANGRYLRTDAMIDGRHVYKQVKAVANALPRALWCVSGRWMAGLEADAGSTRAYMGSGGPSLSSGLWRVLNNGVWVAQHVWVEEEGVEEAGDYDGHAHLSQAALDKPDAEATCREGTAKEELKVDDLRAFVNVLFRWDWRDVDGSYVPFEMTQCAELEICYQKSLPVAKLWVSHNQARHFLRAEQHYCGSGRRQSARDIHGAKEQGVECDKGIMAVAVYTSEPRGIKCLVDLEDMTAVLAGSPWQTAVRRWDAAAPIGDSWSHHHQASTVRIVDVEPHWREFSLVLQAFFDRRRPDGTAPRISRETHRLLRVQRVQNRGQYRLFDAHRKKMIETRGEQVTFKSEAYAWHGTGTHSPLSIATTGCMVQCASRDAFYLQGFYTAEQASYSHHSRFVYRSKDLDGQVYDCTGVYHHLLLVRVLRGVPLIDANIWRGGSHLDFAQVYGAMLGSEYDSVEGGPHRPTAVGPGQDDSIIYVTYHPSQVLPEFVVTYVEKPELAARQSDSSDFLSTGENAEAAEKHEGRSTFPAVSSA